MKLTGPREDKKRTKTHQAVSYRVCCKWVRYQGFKTVKISMTTVTNRFARRRIIWHACICQVVQTVRLVLTTSFFSYFFNPFFFSIFIHKAFLVLA